MTKPKNIVLTIDYELFLGRETGDVASCMIAPTEKLETLLAMNNGRMTVFWDILHYYKLLEYQNSFPHLQEDIQAIEKQILSLAKKGHDIQLHLHPHWLDAVYNDHKWHFHYHRFKLQALSEADDKNDIDTIAGCIHISKSILEDLIRKVDPAYNVTTFRAGGYLVQPFSKLKSALIANNILTDTSVCPGLKSDNDIFSYDFTAYPERNNYNFSADPSLIDDAGRFTEVPITTINIPAHRNLYFTLLRYMKYRKSGTGLKGTGAWQTTDVAARSFRSKVHSLSQPRITQFTTDSSFKELFFYMVNKTGENSTMILHPKLLNDHIIDYLTALVRDKRIKFISIKDRLSK